MKYSSELFLKGSEQARVEVDKGMFRQNLGFNDNLNVVPRQLLKPVPSAIPMRILIPRWRM